LSDDEVFVHGVASGDPTTTGIVLWTRVPLAPGLDAGEAAWSVAASESPDRVLTAGTSIVEREQDCCVRVVVEGLAPDTRYDYRFTSNGSASPTGHFRTLPVDPDQVRFAVVTCAKYNAGYFNAYGNIAKRDDLHFVLHLGDYIYEASNRPPASQTPGAHIGRDFEPDRECATLADYRARYAQYRRDPDLAEMHRNHAMIATIDDHEIADNAWSGGAQEHDPSISGPWSTRLESALRAWEEWIPSRCRPVSDGTAIHRELDLGSLARIVVLETRTQRSDPSDPDPSNRTELGAAQLDWCCRSLEGGDRRWTILASPSVLAPLWSAELDREASLALRDLKLVEPGSGTAFHDLWDNYPAERDAILKSLGAAPGQSIVLSGDVHVGFEMELHLNDARVAMEWTTPSVTSQNLDDKRGWEPRTLSVHYESRVRAALHNVRWCNFDDHGYLLVTLERDNAKAEWWFTENVREATRDERCSYSSWMRHE